MITQNKKGDVTSPIVMWLVVIVAVIIIIVWYAQNSSLASININAMDEDLKNIHYDYSLACNHDSVQSIIQLYTKKGMISVNDSVICVSQQITNGDVQRCLPTPCNPLHDNTTLAIENISKVFIEKTTAGIKVLGQ